MLLFSLGTLLAHAANPLIVHVSIVEGHVWLSEDALDDLEFVTGQRPPLQLRELLQFLDTESHKLQTRALGKATAEMNLHGFGLMQRLKHAIKQKVFGERQAGEAPSIEHITKGFQHGTVQSISYALH